MIATAAELEFVSAQANLRDRIEKRMTPMIVSVADAASATLRDDLIEAVQAMVSEFGLAAATFAADWYNDMRSLQDLRDEYVGVEYVQDFDQQVDKTVRRALGFMFQEEADVPSAVDAITSKAVQYAIDGARNTIVENSYRDQRASGWARVPHGKTCDFCLMLVGRGGVYRSAAAARFKAHGHCDCGAVPSWDPSAAEVPSIAYQASTRMQALRDRADAGDRGAQRQLRAYRDRVASYIQANQDEFARLRTAYDLQPAAMPAL